MNQTKNYCVYELIDPRDGKMKYIGATNNFIKRINMHGIKSNKLIKKDLWINELIELGLKFDAEILCQAQTSKEIRFYERVLIQYFTPEMNSIDGNYSHVPKFKGVRLKHSETYAFSLLPLPVNMNR